MFVRASHVRVGLVCALLLLAPGRGGADAPLRFTAGATTGQTHDVTGTPGLVLGGSLTLSRWSPFSSLTLVPQLELQLARRHASFALDGTGSASHAMDFIELPLVLRAELTIRGRSVYTLAGAYGGVLLQAQRTRPDGIVDRAGLARRVDLGLLAGGGFELASFAWGELFLEARYQRGSRGLLLDHDQTHEALSLLLNYGLGYGLGSETSDAPSWAHDRRLAVTSGLVATRLPSSEFASYGPGISFGGAFSPARIGSRVALVPQLELAFVHRRARSGDAAARSLALDSLELSLLLRGEVPAGGRTLYGLGGVYGSALLRAQRTDAGVITGARDAVRAVDAGWLAGAGLALMASPRATLSLELRYQRGIHDLFPAGPDAVTGQSVFGLVGIAVGSAPRPPPGRSLPDEEGAPGAGVAALDAIEARATRLVRAMERSAPARPRGRAGTSSCDARGSLPAASGVLAMPAECTMADARHTTREAFRAVLLALARDLASLVARLKRLARDAQDGASPWGTISPSVLEPAVPHVQWMVEALHAAQEQLARADAGRHEEALWQQAGRHYEAALLGAQVLAVWVSWLDFARRLTVDTRISAEWILMRVARPWREMEPVLEQLRRGGPARIRNAARTLQHELPAWSEGLYAWGQEAARAMRQGQQVLQALQIVQAAFDLATMREVIRPLIGRAGGVAFVLPGIGGITAGGAATGVRVVISAEWVQAMQHLIAIGAISTVEIAQIAGVSSLASAPVPRPAPPALPPDGRSAAGAPAAPQPRPVQVLVQHRGGNRQVEVNGQRWHLPKGKSAKDIPASDPVGDRLQAEVDRIARGWGPGKLSAPEQNAINKARAAGQPWLARLLESEARGRWVESRVSDAFKEKMPQLQWNRRGVDAVDRKTGIMYEVLSGTADNLNLHARRMAGELFRMIIF